MNKKTVQILKIEYGRCSITEDAVALEKHFAVIINGKKMFSLSCTPEALEELVLGRLYTEGMIHGKKQVKTFRILPEQEEIQVTLNSKITPFAGAVHGGALKTALKPGIAPEPFSLFQIADEIFENSGELFRETGCAHSCALHANGKILCRFEDIGRHNALDKAVGSALKKGCSLTEAAVFTSGRISGDYLAKIIRAGIPTVVSRAAVTEDAVKMARSKGIILYGFVRKGRGNCYTFDK